MNFTKYIPRTLALVGVSLYAAVAIGCGESLQNRIERTASERNAHIIYFDPALKLNLDCAAGGISDYLSKHRNAATYFIREKPNDNETIAAILVAPKEIGKQVESDIERIARACEIENNRPDTN